ncbi:conserved hypothetical protein [Deferribacter desulfuricans SSM1]|uniref:Sulfatase-modifying factor enzyme-like domain-containing protein n=1 Tax=Deferribacter desulfuricans (strain DSM 14783 / JCM 11476 / NBRC 101012 / SSM1) TaxID=639282 RepID=D3PB27_DEFDS|nr:formylglycine-generating enzyme family protein [Deferribacter desulfuricans]BAI79800.1 conserved hypothetical protein [Deferribacter desulfuricans SSM1]
MKKFILITLFFIFSLIFSNFGYTADYYIEPTTGIKFVRIPGGCFWMGDNNGNIDEKPLHKVCVDEFYMSIYEITNEQYRKFEPKHNSGKYKGYSLNGDKQPVVNISWEDAKNFTKWLSKRNDIIFRLPTEAEWEYTARAGSRKDFYWGDNVSVICEYANVHDTTSKKTFKNFTWDNFQCNDGFAVTAPVGSFKPNKFGLYDMLGNVWEWTEDVYAHDYYLKSPLRNPKGPKPELNKENKRVIRGGGWPCKPSLVRLASRNWDYQDSISVRIGFRIVMIKN